MNFNQITSNMSFYGAVIRELSITNERISMDDNIKKGFGMDVDIEEVGLHENGRERIGKVILDIVIELDDENAGRIFMKMEGTFAVDTAVEQDEFRKMLLLNGATALYSIARGKLECITANVYQSGKITMPMVNMYQFYKENAK